MLPLALIAVLSTQNPATVQAVATVGNPFIDEMSGIVKSRRYDDVYWVHNDSGDSARIFAIDGKGKIVATEWTKPEDLPKFPGFRVQGAENSDWEDIAYDGENLYLCDVGNNSNARRDLGIYVLPEPNPRQSDHARVVAHYPVAYPDQKDFPPKGERTFDCEAVFWLRGKLHLLTKHRNPLGLPMDSTVLYRLDNPRADRVNVLTKVDEKRVLGGWVTGADVSPDGKTLAVLTHFPLSSVWLFDTKEEKMLSRSTPQRYSFVGAEQCEAVCWDGNNTIVVTNEQRSIFRLDRGKFTVFGR